MAASVEQAMESLEDEVRRRDDFVPPSRTKSKPPMTAMLGYADLLRSRDIGQSAREKAADYVYHETKTPGGIKPETVGTDAPWPRGRRAGERAAFRRVQRCAPRLRRAGGANVTFADARGVWVLADKPLLADLCTTLW